MRVQIWCIRVDFGMGRKPKSIQAKFFDKLQKGEHPDECWLWQGKTYNGYAQIGTLDGKGSTTLQRFAFTLLVGPIPVLHEIDHLCGIRHCANPRHLEAVTPAENKRRASVKSRLAAHCRNGHEWTEENTYHPKVGYRACKACQRVGQAKFNQKKAALAKFDTKF